MTTANPALGAARRLHDNRDTAAAEAAYRQLLTDHPQAPEVWRSLGDLCRERGDWEEAEQAYLRALQIEAADAESLNGLGITLAQVGRRADAVERFQQAVAAAPRYAQARHNLGVALVEMERPAEAVEAFKDAIAINPGYVEAFQSLGNTYSAQSEHARAVDAYREALRRRPDSADALNGLGLALTSLHRPGEAAVVLRQAIRLRPDMTGAFNNLGLALAESGLYAEAEVAYDRALMLEPTYAEALVNLGNAHKEQARLPEALICYDMALWLKPQSATARWNRSLVLLQSGDFVRGWAEYEARWMRKGGIPRRRHEQPRWDGSPIDGRRILVYSEQGLGDVVQFSRYVRLLKERGATVNLETPAPLRRLLASLAGVDQLVLEGQPLPSFDCHASVMDLPALFATTLQTIPNEVPYLAAEPVRREHWREMLRAIPGRKIGIAWQGNPHHQWDRHRSIPLRLFETLCHLEGITLVSLQRGPGAEQIDQCPDLKVVELLPRDLPDDIGIAEAAAIAAEVDLVITVDTAVAHIAGALGARTWVLLSTMVDWRWLLHRADSPWYPTMRLFRQDRRDAWDPVFAQIAEALLDDSVFETSPSTTRSMHMEPLISCVCITRGRPSLLRRAIHCFDTQAHRRKELVVVAEEDDTPTLELLDLLQERADLVAIVVPREPKQPLGALRNIGIRRAAGEYIAQWDDDDFYHADRLKLQLEALQQAKTAGCVLHRWIIHKDGKAVVSSYRKWEGSLLCRKSVMPAYPGLHRGEDTPVIEQLEADQQLCVLDRPDLYVYAFHGANTWNEPHWDAAQRAGSAPASPEQFPILVAMKEYDRSHAENVMEAQPEEEAVAV